MDSINIEDLKKYTNYKLIDIRTKEDYMKGHLPGALNIELEDILAFPNKYLSKNLTYVIYCDEGKSSLRLVQVLKKNYDVISLNGGYLNFMGNEFGHPEWIDFPREGNGWSYKYARRQWNLVDNKDLCYHYLGDFDREMINVIKSEKNFNKTPVQEIWHNDGDQVLAFMRGDLLFVFNFSPTKSFTDYGFLVPTGSYSIVLDSDNVAFGGNGLNDDTMTHLTNYDALYVEEHKEWLKLYLPARSALVLKKN